MAKRIYSPLILTLALLSQEAYAQWGKRADTYADFFVVSGQNIFAPSSKHLYRSSDDALTWVDLGTDTIMGWVRGLAVCDTPSITPNIFAATDGRGVWKSSDQGSTWSAVNQGIPTHCTTAAESLGNNLFVGSDQDS